MYFKKKKQKKTKTKQKQKNKIKKIIKAGCDTFNRFHSPVIVHQKHEGAVTRHEFLSSSAKKHLQLTGSFFLAMPLPSVFNNTRKSV
jgi:hypothetical protein